MLHQDQSPPLRHYFARAPPLHPRLNAVGQCAFGIALLSITVGIYLCVWAFLGSSSLPLRIAGPICVRVGILIYVARCFVYCGECTHFHRAMSQNALESKTRDTLSHLATENVIKWIQSEQRILEEFRNLSSIILDNRRLVSTALCIAV